MQLAGKIPIVSDEELPEAQILIVPVDCYGISCDNWFKQEYGIDRTLGELARCGNQFVGDIKSICPFERLHSKVLQFQRYHFFAFSMELIKAV